MQQTQQEKPALRKIIYLVVWPILAAASMTLILPQFAGPFLLPVPALLALATAVGLLVATNMACKALLWAAGATYTGGRPDAGEQTAGTVLAIILTFVFGAVFELLMEGNR